MFKSYVKKSFTKEAIKSFYRNFLLVNNKITPVLVASIGRSGSTMLYESLIKSSAKKLGINNNLILNTLRCEAWNLKKDLNPINGCIYKTHDLPSELLYSKKFKVIYLHDKPSQIITSIFNITNNEGVGWLKLHLKHLRSDEKFSTRFLQDEIFNIKDHLVQWQKVDAENTLFIHYEDIWSKTREIEEFVDFSIEIPPKIKRSSNDAVPESIKNKIKEMYEPLDNLYEKLYL